MDISQEILSDIIIYSNYARYIPSKNRREVWNEIVERNRDMHNKKYKELNGEIDEVYNDFVLNKKVLPSMRSMQFAGKPIEISPNRIYNCAYLPIDDYRAFSEIMFLLLGGCLEKGTEIKTSKGNKKIEDVTIEDEILTFDEKTKEYYWIKPVYAGEILSSKNKRKVEIEFEDSSIIRCTEDHKFYTKNRGWVKAINLKESDDIENWKRFAKIKQIREIKDNRTYYDLSVEKTHCYVLANGSISHNTGIGSSVQKHHIELLPEVMKPVRKRRFLISDSIEGWADAVKTLMKSYLKGTSLPEFDFSDIRLKGSRLKTSGGIAPGPEPLKDCLHNIKKILDRKENGSKLTSLEVHDIICFIADGVLAGGIRRCLPSNYLVMMADGTFKKISECSDGDFILFNNKKHKIKNVFKQGKQELIKINTANGYHISTENHRWLVLDKKNDETKFIEAKEIKKDSKRYAFLNKK